MSECVTEAAAKPISSRELEQLLHRDRSTLLLTQPFTAGLAMRLDIAVVNGRDAQTGEIVRPDPRITTAATDGRTIFFDADFTAKLDSGTRRFVLCHEVWHCVMGHLRRQLGRDHQRWNRAIDYEVNNICRVIVGFVPEMALYNMGWSQLSAEEIYELIERGEEFPEQLDHEVLDQHLPADHLVAQQWRELLQQALLNGRHIGSLPYSLRQRLQQALSPRLPWQHILQRFVQRQASGERQWYPPARRHVHRGLYLPRQRSEYLELTIAIDTSGSCAQDLGKFLAQLNFLFGNYRSYDITVLQCDTRIVSVEHYTPERPLRVSDFEFKGFGGTRFQPAFDYVREHPTNALVYFTDGYGREPVNHSNVPVLWVLTQERFEPMRCGESVRMQ